MPVPKGYKHKKLGSAKSCAAGSFRRVKRGGVLVTVCCPRGKWSKRSARCRVGMKAIGVDVKKGSRRDFGDQPWWMPPPSNRYKIKLR